MRDVRVFVIDDHELFRRTAAAVVDATEGFVVVGSADSFEAAADALAGVDLVLMDVNLPGLSGIDAARLVRDGVDGTDGTDGTDPPVVVLLSTYDEATFEWADSGAADYIAKSGFSPVRLVQAWESAPR